MLAATARNTHSPNPVFTDLVKALSIKPHIGGVGCSDPIQGSVRRSLGMTIGRTTWPQAAQ